jgi:sec-independent protein translocase protein TatB
MGTPPPIELASLGMADTLILMVLALVVFGPRRLPQIGRQIGKLMYEFRKASNDFKFQMEEELRLSEEADRRKKEEEERQRAAAIAATILPPPEAPSPALSIEAEADIGALEPATASPAVGEANSVEGFPPEVAERVAEPVSTIPRLQPPQTGEQVTASRPGPAPERAGLEADGSSLAAKNGSSPAPEGREPNQPEPDLPAPVAEAAVASNPGVEPGVEPSISPKESVSQHG